MTPVGAYKGVANEIITVGGNHNATHIGIITTILASMLTILAISATCVGAPLSVSPLPGALRQV
jgi:hypothetical protein